MKHNIYNADQHIDFDKIEKLLDDNTNKEIICFGGGTAAQILSEKLLHKYNVTCFLDNNDKIWGTEICGCKVCEPSILKNKTRDSYIVLILSKHAVQISKQLEDFGLEKDVDYFDIYKEFSAYFRIKKFEGNVLKFLDFIDRIPKGTFDNVEKQQGAKAGIVCSGSMAKNAVCYAFGQCLVSMYHGYDATLIVDTLKGYDDYIYFEDYHKVVRIYIEYVVGYIVKLGINIKVDYVSEDEYCDITTKETSKLKYLSEATLSWLDSRKDEVFLHQNNEREDISYQILCRNYSHIKAFFDKKTYDVLSVFTGMHKHRCLYTLIAREKNMRVSTYDGGEGGAEIGVNTNGISSQSPDIKMIIHNNMLSDEERGLLAARSKELLEQRQNSTVKENAKLKTKIINYQIVPQNDNVEKYDILVPLNILWDSAALWVDKLFYNWREWLEKLVEYVYNNTNATMIIREHPAQNHFSGYNFVDISEELRHLFDKYSDRITFVKADEKLNTYSCLKYVKLVLPYTSTIGLESVCMGKTVIMHTNTYYSEEKFLMSPSTQEEYFDYINKILQGKEYVVSEYDRDTARIMYYLKMNDMLPSIFTEAIDDWMDYEFIQLCEEDGVKKIMDCIYKAVPICFARIKDELYQL